MRQKNWKNRFRLACDKVKLYMTMYNNKYSIVNTFIVGTIVSIIAIFIDYNNILSEIFTASKSRIPISVLALIGILLVLLCIKYKLLKTVKYPLMNRFDYVLFLSTISLILYKISSYFNYINLTDKISWINYFVLVLLFLFVYRIIQICKNYDEKKKSTVVDLKQVIDDEVGYDIPFVIREKAVGYDLLNREYFVKELSDLIKSYISEERFVIGVEGSWGSGKTTFLNSLVDCIDKDEQFIIINDFEPWLSENKESLLNNLINTILVKSKLEIPKKDIDFFIKSISELVLGKKYFSSIIDILKSHEDNQIKNIVFDINYLIEKSNKKIVFIIDNLDRLRPENIFLMLNIINNVLDFNNLIIILSYDKKEIGKSLESINISTSYLDKIVQKKIILPLMRPEDMYNIYLKTILKLLNSSNIEHSTNDVKLFVEILSNNQVGLREFKRFVNTSILPFIFNSRKISIIDFLVLEYLRSSNIELYNYIYVNQEYFISSDQGMEMVFRYMDEESMNAKINSVFDNAGIKQNLEGQLLSLSFPNVKNYIENKKRYKNIVQNSRYNPEYIEIQKNKRVSSGKFFNLYFTNMTNNNSEVVDITKAFIEYVKEYYKESQCMDECLEQILKLDKELQLEMLTNLSYYIDEFSTEEYYFLAKFFLDSYFSFSNYKTFLALDTENCVSIIISLLLENVSMSEFKNLLGDYTKELKNLTMISNVIYWLEHSSDENNKEKIEFLEEKTENLIINVLEGDFDLFNSQSYTRKNVLQIYRYLQEKGQLERYRKFLEVNLNEFTYFKILNILVVIQEGDSGYYYSMNEDFETLIDAEVIKVYQEKVTPKNEKQELLNEVLEVYLNKVKDENGEYTVKRTNPVDLSSVD